MKRIAFIHGCFPAGGAERITVDVAEYLNNLGGYEIFVYTSKIEDELLTSRIEANIKIRIIPNKRKLKAAEIEKLIIRDNINIVVQVASCVYGIKNIACRTGCKTVLANHGEPFWQRYSIMNRRQNSLLKKILWKIINKRIYQDNGKALRMAIKRNFADYKNNDAYVVLCDAYKKETEKAFGLSDENSRIYVIENPEYHVEDISLDKRNIILYCGRLECLSKRIERLLRIWATIQDELSDWELMLVGDGPQRNYLESMAKKLDLKRCSFEGKVNNVKEYYKKASIVCLVSQTEGWPLALTEAQAQGCIPVAFGCTSGVIDILSPHGENGFIVKPFDEKEYAETLLKIAGMSKNDQEKIRLSAIAKRREYSPDKTGEKYKNLFEKLLANK